MKLPALSPRTKFAAFLAWFVVLWWLSSRSIPPIPLPKVDHFDKVCHISYFAVGGVIFATLLAAKLPAWRVRTRVFTAVVFLLLIGMLDEYHQTFTPNRSGNDPGDLAADAIGATLGSLACSLFLRKQTAGIPPEAQGTASTPDSP